MKNHIVFFILMILISFSSFSAELNAEFVIDNNVKTLREGELFSATLRVWPIEDLNKDEFNKLIGTNLFNAYYLLSIDSLEPSLNNADVVELKAHFAAVNNAKPEDYVVIYEGQKVNVKFQDIVFKKLEANNKKFEVLDQEDEKTYKLTLLILILIISILFLIYKRKLILEKFKKKPVVNPKEKYRLMFVSAKERLDYEYIYREKEVWTKLLNEISPAHRDFFNTLNKYQFKKEWNSFEKNEVAESFDVIRRSFE